MLQTEERNYKLAKNQYEGYQYIDLDNFYTYENSFVLINKQNILDPNLEKTHILRGCSSWYMCFRLSN